LRCRETKRCRHRSRASASLARELDAEPGAVEIRRFPDGESYVRVLSQVRGRECLLACTLDRPDDKILPLLFLAATARELGAERVTLIAPYLAYMRQDRRFQPGESVTSACFARFLSGWIDQLVTVDPHLHRRSSLEEIYAVPCTTLHAAALVSRWIQQEVEGPLLVGPDVESEQWVSTVARDAGSPWIVLRKERLGDSDVRISVPDLDPWRDRTPVLVDDIISTARTMIETVGHLVRAGLKAPVCVGVHAVFAGSALPDLRAAGAGRIVTCNTIPHPSNGIDVGPLIARGLQTQARRES
jgi:ribose-phosphate pyrophosphokinase